MINTVKTPKTQPKGLGKQRSYNEVIEYLNAHWSVQPDKDLSAIKSLDKALGNPSKKFKAIFVAGTNGKSLTANYTAQLLRSEGMNVGSFYSPHILTYNERFSLNNEMISNKTFTEIANEVITVAETENINARSLDILTAMAFSYFANNDADVALLEATIDPEFDPITICHPSILAITRMTNSTAQEEGSNSEALIAQMTQLVQAKTHVVSADQSKIALQDLLEKVEARGGVWGMPIRKLAILPYPFEQLHGRCAALAERIGSIFLENFVDKNTLVGSHSLLSQERGRRGRPTLEAKRQAELNPKRTLEQFWKEAHHTIPGRFQLFDKEKPTVLLDNARNVDALKNLLLGVRLLHYQRPLKGIAFVLGCDKNQMYTEEFLRCLRYFTKKNTAQVFFCPIETTLPGVNEVSWNVEDITNDIKNMKIKARACSSFQEAFEAAKKTVDERHGLIVVSGSESVLAAYWDNKGIKKI
jgi:dihydrofolate synthase/folylpolyglutamate synthase